MPGHTISGDELRQAMLGAAEVAVAHAGQDIADRATYLAPKRTDELAADIHANRTNRSGNTVTCRVHTASIDYYGIMNEQKDWYHHRVGQAHYMRDALLSKAGELGPDVAAALKAVTG